jgi:hypothetical protein
MQASCKLHASHMQAVIFTHRSAAALRSCVAELRYGCVVFTLSSCKELCFMQGDWFCLRQRCENQSPCVKLAWSLCKPYASSNFHAQVCGCVAELRLRCMKLAWAYKSAFILHIFVLCSLYLSSSLYESNYNESRHPLISA